MTVKMSSDNLDRDHCPKCGIAMNDCTDYSSRDRALQAALKPFAEVGERFVSAVENGGIPAGASISRLRTDPLLASDLVAAARAYQQEAERKSMPREPGTAPQWDRMIRDLERAKILWDGHNHEAACRLLKVVGSIALSQVDERGPNDPVSE